MVIQFNLPSEGKRLREFYVSTITQMPLLLDAGLVPLPTDGFMRRRIEVLDQNFGAEYRTTPQEPFIKIVRNGIWKGGLYTGDAVVYDCLHKNKRKIVLDAPFLRALTYDSPLINLSACPLVNGALDMEWYILHHVLELDEEGKRKISPRDLRAATRDWYRNLDAPEFTQKQVEGDRFRTVWLTLARDDKSLLKEYREAVKVELKAKGNYDRINMTLGLGSLRSDPKGRIISRLFSIGDGYYSSTKDLNANDGRLLGVTTGDSLIIRMST